MWTETVSDCQMRLNHVNVRCTDIEVTREFFETTVGLKPGLRPQFPFPGYWMVDDEGRPVVHLMASRRELGEAGAIDHFAFSFDDFESRVDRLREMGHTFELRQVPGTDVHQFAINGPDGVRIEFQGQRTKGPESRVEEVPALQDSSGQRQHEG